jgi:hypothetical protein
MLQIAGRKQGGRGGSTVFRPSADNGGKLPFFEGGSRAEAGRKPELQKKEPKKSAPARPLGRALARVASTVPISGFSHAGNEKGRTMEYTIKAHPTTYRDVRFRSRLEATWAAYFDLAGVAWEYEPFDLEGWTPDLLLRVGAVELLAEIKPVLDPSASSAEYAKAIKFNRLHWVALLGRAPLAFSVGLLFDQPGVVGCDVDLWLDLHEKLRPLNAIELWAQASNITRWHPKGAR